MKVREGAVAFFLLLPKRAARFSHSAPATRTGSPQVMLHDRYLYDRTTGNWTVDRFLEVRQRHHDDAAFSTMTTMTTTMMMMTTMTTTTTMMTTTTMTTTMMLSQRAADAGSSCPLALSVVMCSFCCTPLSL